MSEARCVQGVLRFGMIGCGALGVIHAERLSALPGVDITAVSDPDPAAMRRTAAAGGLGGALAETHFGDYQQMLADATLDAVCISSPNRWHVQQLLASLKCGLHVLCEKPLTMAPSEVEQVVRATDAAGKVAAIAYQSRYRRDARILKRALQTGRWGSVTSVSIFAGEDWITPNAGTWRHDPARCPGGFFADANGHQLDLVFWLTGLRPEAVRAQNDNRGTPVPMATWGDARLTGDVPLTFTFLGDLHTWREEIEIRTDGADFLLRDTHLLWSDGSAPLGPLPDSEIDPADLEPADTPDGAFVAALRGGPPVVSPPETVWPVLQFTLAALESAARGVTVTTK